MKSAVIFNQTKYTETAFRDEHALENIVKTNSHILFGEKTIYFDIKNKIATNFLGATIPDAFLVDFSEEEPAFYLVEIELARHDFYRHIFSQITKFFAFFKSPENRDKLVGKLFDLIKSDNAISREFKTYLGEKEIYKELKDMVEENPNILLLIDDDKPELKEVTSTYADTWGKMVKIEILRKFESKDKEIYTISPDFRFIEFVDETDVEETEKTIFDEHYHLEDVNDDIIAIYNKIKLTMLEFDPKIQINPQKYYVSLRKNKNFAFLKIKKKRIRIVIMLPLKKAEGIIKIHKINPLSEGVQGFYNGPCFIVDLENDNRLDEIFDALKEAYAIQK
jgi:predicted transport protein